MTDKQMEEKKSEFLKMCSPEFIGKRFAEFTDATYQGRRDEREYINSCRVGALFSIVKDIEEALKN